MESVFVNSLNVMTSDQTCSGQVPAKKFEFIQYQRWLKVTNQILHSRSVHKIQVDSKTVNMKKFT